MPSLINRVPPGLLSLFGIKALGVNPSILTDELQSVIDVTRLYVSGNSQELIGTGGAVNVPGPAVMTTITVPAGELWIAETYTIYASANLAAGTTYRVSPCVQNTATNSLVGVGAPVTATAGERLLCYADTSFLMPSNTRVSLFCHQYTAGTPQAFTFALRYLALAI